MKEHSLRTLEYYVLYIYIYYEESNVIEELARARATCKCSQRKKNVRNDQASINRRIAEIDRWGGTENLEEIKRSMRSPNICIYASKCECECMRARARPRNYGLWNLIVNGSLVRPGDGDNNSHPGRSP